jgi:Zn-dependent protease
MTPKRSIYLGKYMGLKVDVAPSSFVTAILGAGAIFLLLNKAFKWRRWAAVTGGILATTMHFLSDFWHQIGHARAAEQTGYPMAGITFVGPLAFSVYPKNEGLLPPETHIQRALGGPIFSLLLTVGIGLVALLTRFAGGLPLFLALFTFLDNLLVFTIGALLPLGFTDGSTILTWWGQRKNGRFSL